MAKKKINQFKLYPLQFPVKECADCCQWAILGKDHCSYHLYKPAAN